MFGDNNFFGGGAKDFYDHPIEQSLRFNDDDSPSLTWTPSSAGNRKTWTWSGWVKRGNIDTSNSVNLFSVEGQTYNNNLRFTGSGSNQYTFHIQFDGGNGGSLLTNALYRDTSAWYHVVVSVDTTQATSSDRVKLYINGEQITSLKTSNYPSQNYDTGFNASELHSIGRDELSNNDYLDGYLAEVHFIDGQALDASSFGETKSGVWIPKAYSGSYGTNGFYLPFNHDYSVEGFSATTYRGTGSDQYIGGVGFQPDLVWAKNRSSAIGHVINDSVRGAGYNLTTNSTDAESYGSNRLTSFDTDGFSLGDAGAWNTSGDQYVAWCWDAGSGSPVSNTDGSITSTVKASTDYGFSIVSYTGTGSNATVGHGLSSAPEMVIVKNTNTARLWAVYHTSIGATHRLVLNDTLAAAADSGTWNNTAPTSSVFNVGTSSATNNSSSENYIAYCFHSVSGYSKIGSYTGTGSSGNSVTTGFKPAFVMIKRTDDTGGWEIWDNTRDTQNPIEKTLQANTSSAELTSGRDVDFDSDGFTIQNTTSNSNASGGTYIYMAFADKREAAFWLDQSGNNNDFENNNLTESDISLDSPTNNFCTWNPLTSNAGATSSATLSEGNLKWLGTYNNDNIFGTMGASSGKYYYEAYLVSNYDKAVLGWSTSDELGNYTESALAYYNSAGIRAGNTTINWDTAVDSITIANADVFGFALDIDGNSLKVYRNGSLVSTITTPTDKGDTWMPIGGDSSTTDASFIANFGQDSSFAGNKTAQGNTDDNGIGDFYYAPPTGYLALCTANLEVPDAMNPALDNSPQDYFNTVLYTGNQGTNLNITGVGFQPDLVWGKNRSGASNHWLFDSVRGTTKMLQSDQTVVEETQSGITSFNADGFTLGTWIGSSKTNDSYAAWNWKANGSGVSNTDGSITSTVSANTDAGFSIVSYHGDGVDNSTVGHGLSQTPDLVIIKNRDYSVSGWMVTGNTGSLSNVYTNNYHYMYLHNTDALNTASSTSTVHGSSVLTFADSSAANNNSNYDYIAYCFHSVEGFSKFGSYTGNGSTDGSFIYCGFRPALIVVKNTTSATGWEMYDDERIGFNEQNNVLRANDSAAELSYSGRAIDLVSNGFKVRSSDTPINASGNDYIFMAFAENPFKYSTAR